MPLNDIRERVIIEKAHLIIEERMPQCLLDFVTHVVGYKAVLARWAEGDYSERRSTIGWPPEFDVYVRAFLRRIESRTDAADAQRTLADVESHSSASANQTELRRAQTAAAVARASIRARSVLEPLHKISFVTGHDFSRAGKRYRKTGALAPDAVSRLRCRHDATGF